MKTLLSAAFAVFALLLGVPLIAAAQPPAPAPDVERLLLVQGSVGQDGREYAYLNFQNGDQVTVTVTVQYVRALPHMPILRTYEIPPEGRVSIDITHDVPELRPRAYFSVIATVDTDDGLPAAVDMRMTWHRAPDRREVETLTAVVRRSPKR